MPIAHAPYTAHLPMLQAKDLNGHALSLPADLPGERTIAIVAFQREQQRSVDSWTHGLKPAESSLPWLELPVIDDPGAIARWFNRKWYAARHQGSCTMGARGDALHA